MSILAGLKKRVIKHQLILSRTSIINIQYGGFLVNQTVVIHIKFDTVF
jgi:hypothetical protein